MRKIQREPEQNFMKTNSLKIDVRPKDYISDVKKYMETLGLQFIVILKGDESCIIRLEDNLYNLSKFKQFRKFLNNSGLSFNWRNINSEILPQLEIIISTKG